MLWMLTFCIFKVFSFGKIVPLIILMLTFGISVQSNRRTIMDDPFIRNYIEDLLKNVRTQVLLKLIKPYTRIRIPFISKVWPYCWILVWWWSWFGHIFFPIIILGLKSLINFFFPSNFSFEKYDPSEKRKNYFSDCWRDVPYF